MISADTCVSAAADRLTRYRAALDSLAAHAGITERPRELFETCEHMTPIAQDCDSCEPLRPRSRLRRGLSDNGRRGIFA